MSLCVNHSSREFQDALKKFDISEGQLENIVYEFINQPGNVDKFPSDEYIQDATQGRPERGISPVRYDMWRANYSVPQVFSTREDMENAVGEAKKYFMDYSIGVRESKDGKYYMTVAKPTKRAGSSDMMFNRQRNTTTYNYVRDYYREQVREQAKAAYDMLVRSMDYYKELANNSLFTTEGVTGVLRQKEMMDLLNNIRSNTDIVGKSYILNLKDGRKKVVFTLKPFDEYLEDRLNVIDEWSDYDIELEAIRIHNELGNEDLLYYISRKKREGLEEQIKNKNPYVSDEEINEAIAFLSDDLPNTQEDNQYVDCCIRWLKNDSISLPRDNANVREAFDLARKYGMDTSKYKSPFDLILDVIKKNDKDVTPGEKFQAELYEHIHLNKVETITDKNGVERTVEVYDVDDNELGQQDVVNILARCSVKVNGKPLGSQWCLSTFNYDASSNVATPTESSKHWWKNYPNGKRQIAIYDGKPIAFNSSKQPKDEWWDFYDTSNPDLRSVDYESAKVKYAEFEEFGDDESKVYTLGKFRLIMRGGQQFARRYSDDDFSVSIENHGPNYYYYIHKRSKVNTGFGFDALSWSLTKLDEGNTSLSFQGAYNFISKNQSNNVWGANDQTHKELSDEEKEFFNMVYQPTLRKGDYGWYISYGKKGERQYKSVGKKLSADIDKYLNDVDNIGVSDLDWTPRTQIFKHSLDTLNSRVEELRSVHDDLAKRILEIDTNEFKKYATDARIKEYFDKKNEAQKSRLAQAAQARHAREIQHNINETLTRNEAPNVETAMNATPEYFVEAELTDIEKRFFTGNKLDRLARSISKATGKLFSQTDVLRGIRLLQEKNYTEAYEKGVKKAINQELLSTLEEILTRYHFDIVRTDLTEAFGDDVLGAFDVLQKIIYLSNNEDRSAIVDAEEFSHAFIKMMGAVYHRVENRRKYPETAVYSRLRDGIERADFYQKIYDEYKDKYKFWNGQPDTPKIKEEALGKALAATILERYEVKSAADKSFFSRLKKWFNDILAYVRSKITDYGKLEKELNDIADSIIDGTYARKYLNKIDDTGYSLQTLASTIQRDAEDNNGFGLNAMRTITNLGGIVTGSVSFRGQGTVYRKDADSLHDIDSIWTEDVTHIYEDNPELRSQNNNLTYEQLKEKVLANNKVISLVGEFADTENPLHLVNAFQADGKLIATFMATSNPEFATRFEQMTGSYATRLEQFTDEERSNIHLIDTFFVRNNPRSIYEDGLQVNFADYRESFREKLKFGRAKDLYDYQNFNPFSRRYIIQQRQDNEGVMFHITDNVRAETREYFDNIRRVVKSMDNLYKDSTLSATEIREEGVRAANWMSDMLTEYQKNPEAAIHDFNLQNTTKEELSSLSRRELLMKININNLIDYYKNSVLDSVNNELLADADDDLLDKVDLIKENLDGVLQFGVSTFRQNEKFGFNLAAGELEEVAETQDEYEELVGDDIPEDSDTVYEDEGSDQEHWQLENNAIDVLYNATESVRAVLNQAYLYDKNDNIQKDYLGRNQRLTAKEATIKILGWIDGAFNLDMMVSKLQQQQEDNPWLGQIIERLTDKAGNETDFQSQFFTAMYKPFMSYSVGIKDPDTGLYYVKSLNEKTAASEIVRGVRAKYNMGAFPLVGNSGVVKTALDRLAMAQAYLKDVKSVSNDNRNDVIAAVEDASALLGYHISPDVIEQTLNNNTLPKIKDALSKIVESLTAASGNTEYNPFKFKGENGISGYVNKFFINALSGAVEDIQLSSVYSGGKMRQSHITPSYAMKLMSKLRGDQAVFEDTIRNEFGYTEWFVENTGESFEMLPSNMKNLWLKELMKMTPQQRKEVFKHHNMPEFDKSVYMKGMSSEMYALSALAEYFSLGENSKGRSYAYYRVPLLSNKPSSEFISFIRYTGKPSEYQRSIVNGMMLVYNQELARIQTVRMMNKSEGDYGYINNFSKRGRDFVFLDFLNEHLNGSKKGGELGRMLNAKIQGENVDNSRLYELVSNEIYDFVGKKADAFIDEYKRNGIFDAAKKVSNIGTDDAVVEAKLREFYWNDALAAMNITQLFVTDLAYYKDTEDVQKRMAQIHSPGMRGNINVRDYENRPVTDGKIRTVYLKDYTTFVSNVIDNISEVFDRKIAESSGIERENYKKTKEQVIKAFSNNDVANAQAFFSPTSARKFGFMFGTWSRKSEELFNKIRKGEANLDDLNTVFQPMKPFVYSQIAKPVDSFESTPITTLKVPVQNKNAQYLLVMADALLKGEKTSKPNLLRALFDVMENSAANKPTMGIDVIQFESAVKSGLVGVQDLNQFMDIKDDGFGNDGYTLAVKYLEESIYRDSNKNSYDPSNVQELMAEDFSIQHYTPEHFIDASAIWGSQIRAILQSNLGGVDRNGNPVMYEYLDDATEERKKLSAEDFRREYENTAAQLVKVGIDRLSEEFGIRNPDFNETDRNVALSKALQKEINKSSRYSTDLWLACAVDEETGKFRIPLGDPIQSVRIEQLVNSIIKNRVNKVKIAGGPLVQVTSWGVPRQPEIRYADNSNPGKALPLKSEYLAQGHSEAEWDAYKKENQGGILHYECYAPAWTKSLFNDFMDDEGGVDIESLEMLEPGMLELLGYRLPSEDKFSAAPFKIIGFLPKESGDGFMAPYEWTTQTGSDFDDDKARTMRKDYTITKNKISLINAANKIAFRTDLPFKQDKAPDTISAKKERYHIIYDILSRGVFRDSSTIPEGYERELFKAVKEAYLNLRFTVKKPTEGKAYLANKMVEMSLAVMKNENTASQIQVPQGFEKPKRIAYLVTSYKSGGNWETLNGMTTDELKKLAYKGKNIMFFDVQQQFYKQNAAAGQILGMFAVQKSAHALLSENNYAVYVDEEKPFSIAGKEFSGFMVMDRDLDDAGEYIGRSLGSLVGGSADAVKDPIFNLMNVNNLTAGVLTTLIRLGMPIEDACLFLSADIITKALNLYNTRNLTAFMSFNDAINQLKKDTGIDGESELDVEPLTKDEIISALRSDSSQEVNYKVLTNLQRVQRLVEDTRPLTAVTRYNSMASAVGPKIVNSIIQQERLNAESDNLFYMDADGKAYEVGVQDILDRHPLLYQFSRTYDIARDMLHMMPAYSEGFYNVMNHMDSSSIISSNMKKTIMRDDKLLEKLLEFYESYLLVKSGVINPKNRNYFMDSFAQDFQRAQIKKRYANNPFVQAIRVEASRYGKNKGVLTLDTSGMDTIEKERLSSGWAQLQKDNPELSKRLFEDNFFRGGLGYTPKTYMNLTPIQVKEGIDGYVRTFEEMPAVFGPTVVDLFVRNNAGNFKLAPRIDTKRDVTRLEDGSIRVYDSAYDSVRNAGYLRIRNGREDMLFKAIFMNNEAKVGIFVPTTILGNNGEYIDFVGNDGMESAIVTDTTQDSQPSEFSGEEATTEESQFQKMRDIYESVTGNKFSEATSEDIATTLKGKGIQISTSEVDRLRKKYC